MNRFRTKKKGKDVGEGAGRPSNDSEVPTLPTLKPSRTFRRKKNVEPEPKPELDIANALPSSDDFRTSLLMSGLSARFSMLREQDDPNSKLGKASDDSVLFPKRQSRFLDFGFQPNGLSDIAEVASVKDSIRRPFAMDRVNSSYSVDGYGTDDDSTHGSSIMSRAKPGEGNNLFGGRQKIYKIPTGSSSMRNLTSTGEVKAMSGRALYEHDVSQSAFQKLRQQEREQRDYHQDQQEPEDPTQASIPRRSGSPPLTGYNRNRETTSTTSSGPSLTRSSTAATSVTSQRTPSVNGQSTPSTPAIPYQSHAPGLEKAMNKGKRLYETGLDQHLHNQQYSAISRIDTLSRQHTRGARSPSPSPPSPAGARHGDQSSGGHHQQLMRSASPPPTELTLNTYDIGVKQPTTLDAQNPSFGSMPPLSPPMSEGDDHSSLPIQPNDRGKATALGTFSKPIQPYDEIKYTQRQLQMQQGRETPPLRKHSPPRNFRPGQAPHTRTRGESNSTYSSSRSTSSSSAQRELNHQNRNFLPQSYRKDPPTPEMTGFSSGTFLGTPTANSSRDAQSEIGKSIGRPAQFPMAGGNISSAHQADYPVQSEHPAFRQRNPQVMVAYTDEHHSGSRPTIATLNSPVNKEKFSPVEANNPPADSPTLGPGNGLSGLVRQHLRSDSNNSSVYGAPSPGFHSPFPSLPSERPMEDTYSTKSNPFELDDWERKYNNHITSTATANHEPDPRSDHMADPLTAASVQPNVVDQYQTHDVQDPQKSSWQKEMRPHHTRDGSSETQKERKEFANELATRRKRVQENLRSFADSDTPTASPAPGHDGSNDATSLKQSPLGMLKSKPSRGSLVGKNNNGSSKAMKLLGIGNTTINSSPSPVKQQQVDNNLWKQEEEEMLRGVAKSPRGPPGTKAYRQARREAQREREQEVMMRHQRAALGSEVTEGAGGHQRELRSNYRSPSPKRTPVEASAGQGAPASDHMPVMPRGQRAPSEESRSSNMTGNRSGSRPASRGTRDRSSSEASGRSKSRNGRYRDDLAKAMAEGTGSSVHGFYEEVPSARLPRSPAMPNSAFQGSPSLNSPNLNVSNRSRSSSKSTPTSYFDPHQLQPIQTTPLVDVGLSPRPSPVTPFSVNSTPALIQPSGTGSGTSTPPGQGFQSQGRIPAGRKRSVNKADISEPTFVSTTSRITTVNLPAAASLHPGINLSAPPLPPMHPRRRQTRTQTMIGALTGRSTTDPMPSPSLSSQVSVDEMSTFSADEADSKPKHRQKLRKSSSEGGNLNVRARQAFAAAPSPALPGNFTPVSTPHTPVLQGGMF